jgi:hypothetical protein
MKLSFNPATALFYLRDMKLHVHIKTSTQMFIATLPMINKNWRQPNAFQLHKKWIYLYYECYSSIKREQLKHTTT